MAAGIRKILLVDDNQLFLKVLTQAFIRAGFECRAANSAHEALEDLKINIPDAILSDYEMPEMDGLQFRRSLLRDPHFKDVPFVFLTNITNKDLMVEGLDLQAVDYVTKDTPVNVVVTKITNLLNTVSKQRELSELEIRKAATALNIMAVPRKTPVINGFDIDFWHKDYQDIPGGDFIDFVAADDQYLFIVLGDIMGKKWMAWFFTFSFLSYVRAAIRFSISSQEYSTATILQKINQVICEDDMLKDILSSLSLIRLDRKTGEVAYSGAGDLPILHYSPVTHTFKQVSSSGLLLGLFGDGNYTEQIINLALGEQLFIFTDGVIDFANNEGKKTDYNLFAQKLGELLVNGADFEQLKQYLQQRSDVMVDDCSIINIAKKLTKA
jgi:sigma-B regulation protein RsbU (phosphoserine phosphatase)